MTSPSRSRADLRALCQPFHPTPEYLENGPQLPSRAQAEIERYHEFGQPVVPTCPTFDNRHPYREMNTRYPRRQSSAYRLVPVAGDSWRRHDHSAGSTYIRHSEWRPSASSRYDTSPIRYPNPNPVLSPPIQSQYASHSHSGRVPVQPPPLIRRGSSPRLYALSRDPLCSRPETSPPPQRSLHSYNRPPPQTTHRPIHHERSVQEQHSYFPPSGPPTQPRYSSLHLGSPLNLPFTSHSGAGPSRLPFPSYSQPRPSSPLPHPSHSHHSSVHAGPSTWLPNPSHPEPRGSPTPDLPHLLATPLLSPFTLPPPVVTHNCRRPDLQNLLSNPRDQLEAQIYSLEWLLEEAQRRGIDVKAILISHMFPPPIPSYNQPRLTHNESYMRTRKRSLSDEDSDATPRIPKRRRVKTRTTLRDGGSTLIVPERDVTESGEETAKNDDDDSRVKTISREETVVQDIVDRNASHDRDAGQDEITSLHEADRNPTYNETKSSDDNTTLNVTTQHNQSTTHNITARDSEVEDLPAPRQTKTKGKRKLSTILSDDGNVESGPSVPKRLKIRLKVNSMRHNEGRPGSSRSSGAKDDSKDYENNPVDAAPDTTIRDKKANPAVRDSSVPLRRSSRISKARTRTS